jgi:N utilization substance protein B
MNPAMDPTPGEERPGQPEDEQPQQDEALAALMRAVASGEAQPAAEPARKGAGKGLKTADGLRKAASKSARTRAREFAVQALYQHLVGADDVAGIDAFTRELTGFHKADSAHFDALLHGCTDESADLDALIAPHLDRPLGEISPVEHAVMWIGAYEMLHCLDVPWRVVINESIELAKSFGGTDGHKYVNGVLNTIAPKLRAVEVEADRKRRP